MRVKVRMLCRYTVLQVTAAMKPIMLKLNSVTLQEEITVRVTPVTTDIAIRVFECKFRIEIRSIKIVAVIWKGSELRMNRVW